MSSEAFLGHGVVRLELNAHVVVLGGDHIGLLCSTKLPMELGFRSEAAAHFHKVILAHLVGEAKGNISLVWEKEKKVGRSGPSQEFVPQLPFGYVRPSSHKSLGVFDSTAIGLIHSEISFLIRSGLGNYGHLRPAGFNSQNSRAAI